MDLIYSMKRKPLKCEPPHCDSSTDPEVVRPLVSISSANIIAFTSLTELSDVEGDTWGGHVYVCDLDTPWDAHKVMSCVHPVSAIAWDVEGNKLMVANTVGDVAIYGQKDYLLNEWQCLYTATFSGEHVIKCAFFHNGRRVVSLDKKPEAPIVERIQMLRNAPTLKGFGGVPIEGGIIVTRSGLVGVIVNNEGTVATSTQSLRPCRPKLDHAALTYSMDGKIMLFVICRRMVVCAACVVSRSPPEITLQPLPAVSLPASANPTCVWWWGEALGVGGNNVELWRCTDRQHALHDVLLQGSLQGNTTPGGGQKQPEFFNTVWWAAGGAWMCEGGAAVGGAAALGPRAPAAALSPTALMLLHQDSARPMCVRQIVPSGAEGGAGATSPKKPKYSGQKPTLCAVDMSQAGGICVCIDTHTQLHVLAIHRDMPSPILIQQAVTQLEMAGVAGYSCIDIILQAPPDTREAIYERFVESFQRQPAAFQQHYYHSWLKIRIALCRSCASLQTSASWLTCVQSCSAALAAAGAALRQDERPDALLLDDDDDKSVSALEAKVEAAVEAGAGGGAGAAAAALWGGAGAGAAGALRAPLQRAADVALAALAHLPTHHHHHHGYEIWSEPGATSIIRRLVAVWRALSGGTAGGVAAAISRLLPCAAQQRLLHTHKQDLLDECVALSAQSTQPRIWESLPRCNVTSPHGQPIPHYFEYGVEPESLRYVPEPPPYGQACETTPSVTMDSIRYMYLGGGARPARWRQCGRCGARALPAPAPARHPLARAHDARFIAYCRCGGKWTLCSNI